MRCLCSLLLALATSLNAAVDPAALDAARALFNERGKSADAQKAFEALATTDPKNADVNFFLGQLANRRDDPTKAVTYLEAAVAAAPNEARHHHGLGDAYGRNAQKAGMLSKFGLAKKCVASYERAVELAPTNLEFRQSLFEFYRQAPGIAGGGVDKATAQAEAIKKLDAIRGHYAFATLYGGENKFPEALAEFDAILKTKPDDYPTLYQIGRLAATSGQFPERGLAALRRCLELPVPTPNTPGHAATHWRIGAILERTKDVPGARAAYEAAVKLDPKFTPAAAALKKLK